MLAIIQEIASKSYTFREVAAYVTIAVCMSFAVGFLLAAYTRIFADGIGKKDTEWRRLALLPCEHQPGGYRQSTYIEAIKECRRVRNVGLKDAKEMVDKWIASNAKA